MSDAEGGTFFSALARRYPNPHLKEVIPSLPESWQGRCTEKALKGDVPLSHLLVGYARIEPLIHPSWKEVLLSHLPKTFQSRLQDEVRPLSPKLKDFFLNYGVFTSSFKDLPDPSEYVSSPLFFLLNMTQKEVETMIQLLALFSLLEPFMKIVDKARLHKISLLLNETQKQGLSFLLLSPKRYLFNPIDLEAVLRKDKESGRQELFDKGVLLFASLFYGENEALLQLVCYKLEMSLGTKILSLAKQTSHKTQYGLEALQFVFEYMKAKKRGRA